MRVRALLFAPLFFSLSCPSRNFPRRVSLNRSTPNKRTSGNSWKFLGAEKIGLEQYAQCHSDRGWGVPEENLFAQWQSARCGVKFPRFFKSKRDPRVTLQWQFMPAAGLAVC